MILLAKILFLLLSAAMLFAMFVLLGWIFFVGGIRSQYRKEPDFISGGCGDV